MAFESRIQMNIQVLEPNQAQNFENFIQHLVFFNEPVEPSTIAQIMFSTAELLKTKTRISFYLENLNRIAVRLQNNSLKSYEKGFQSTTVMRALDVLLTKLQADGKASLLAVNFGEFINIMLEEVPTLIQYYCKQKIEGADRTIKKGSTFQIRSVRFSKTAPQSLTASNVVASEESVSQSPMLTLMSNLVKFVEGESLGYNERELSEKYLNHMIPVCESMTPNTTPEEQERKLEQVVANVGQIASALVQHKSKIDENVKLVLLLFLYQYRLAIQVAKEYRQTQQCLDKQQEVKATTTHHRQLMAELLKNLNDVLESNNKRLSKKFVQEFASSISKMQSETSSAPHVSDFIRRVFAKSISSDASKMEFIEILSAADMKEHIPSIFISEDVVLLFVLPAVDEKHADFDAMLCKLLYSANVCCFSLSGFLEVKIRRTAKPKQDGMDADLTFYFSRLHKLLGKDIFEADHCLSIMSKSNRMSVWIALISVFGEELLNISKSDIKKKISFSMPINMEKQAFSRKVTVNQKMFRVNIIIRLAEAEVQKNIDILDATLSQLLKQGPLDKDTLAWFETTSSKFGGRTFEERNAFNTICKRGLSFFLRKMPSDYLDPLWSSKMSTLKTISKSYNFELIEPSSVQQACLDIANQSLNKLTEEAESLKNAVLVLSNSVKTTELESAIDNLKSQLQKAQDSLASN